MPARVIPLPTNAPKLIYGEGQPHPPVTIVNASTGGTSIRVDSAQPSDTGGQPLTAGGSLPWDEDLPLWLAGPGTVIISENSGQPFDPGAVANQLLTQGLPAAIASAIYITGTPPVDKYTLVNDSGVFTGNYFGPVIDVSGYQSMNLTFLNGATPANPGNIGLAWYSDAGGAPADLIGFDDFICGTGFITTISVPVRGPFFFVNMVGGAGGGQLKSYASYKAIQNSYYNGIGVGSANGTIVGGGSNGMQNWSGSIPVGNTWTWQPDLVAGPQQLVMRYTTTSSVTLLLRAPLTIYPLVTYAGETNLATINGQMNLYERFLPPMPVELSLQNTHATNALTFRATLSQARPFSG